MKNEKGFIRRVFDGIADLIGTAFVVLAALIIGGVMSNSDREKLEINTDFEFRDANNILGVELVKLVTEELSYGDDIKWEYTYIDGDRNRCEAAYISAYGMRFRMTEAMHLVNFFEGL